MSDRMRPVPFTELLNRIFGEFRNHGSIFSIDEEEFYQNNGKHTIKVFREECATPLGPAAGPHTQLAQNIISSYLVGARFIELKTVQIMDTLEIAKPCIDARDEGYNTEWSTEFTLEKAYDEYVKAWIILHIIESLKEDKVVKTPSFIFNMSVGYNLEGIKKEKMQIFIDSMIDAGKKDLFDKYIKEAEAFLKDGGTDGTLYDGREKKALESLKNISKNICKSVTVSTMHGCPPGEIEAICSYLLEEKHLDTFVKLNPTLLGYDTARSVLDSLGYNYVVLKRESFEHDLQFKDAVSMLHRLVEKGKKVGRGFGVKLTNTLGNVNDKEVLPGDERYASGRVLLPLSTRVALLISKEFNGKMPISYSGGITAFSVGTLFSLGIHPLTLATDMLHPGGYEKMKQMCEICSNSDSGWKSESVDIKGLEGFISSFSKEGSIARKDFTGNGSVKINTSLDTFDCFVAPCEEACPIHQEIPFYVKAASEGDYVSALDAIYDANALPNITSWICDHQCQNHCTRNDYEGPVEIRELKKISLEKGFEDYKKEVWEKPEVIFKDKCAVIGSGPAGLSAAYFLTQSGFSTEVFEKDKELGGVVSSTIPEFRIPKEVIKKDIDFIKDNGVVFHTSSNKTIKDLKKDGFKYIFVCIGADASNNAGIKGNGKTESGISFLRRSKSGEKVDIGKDVIVVGGGNTAMDSSRAAIRTKGVKSVTVLYRRSEGEMPSDREEYKEALKDGVKFYFLSNPVEFQDGVVKVEKMKLGEKDEKGRRKAEKTGEFFTLNADYIITAIGEKVDETALDSLLYSSKDEDVFLTGDATTGPSTVVRCISSSMNAVDTLLDRVLDDGDFVDDESDDDEYTDDEWLEEIEDENEEISEIRKRRSKITLSLKKGDKDFEKREGERCLECSFFCAKCTDVCPNRANVALDVRDSDIFLDPFQILHLDAYCNECGNCLSFCPHDGGPYKKKFTLFSRKDDFDSSDNSGFYPDGDEILVRENGKVVKCSMDEDGKVVGKVSEEAKAMIETVYLSYSYLLGSVEE